jgi:hypothetical protein
MSFQILCIHSIKHLFFHYCHRGLLTYLLIHINYFQTFCTRVSMLTQMNKYYQRHLERIQTEIATKLLALV